MNQSVAIIYNRSLEALFSEQVRLLSEALGGAPCYRNTDFLALKDEEIPFHTCIFLDKDIPLGLRLELLGIQLYNSLGAIEVCDDKRRTGEVLRKELRVPETICGPLTFSVDDAFADEYADFVAGRLGFPLIAKEAFGSLGKQVHLVTDRQSLRVFCRAWQNTPHLFQTYIASSAGRDLRLYVVDGAVRGAMQRHNPNDFRSNLAGGGGGTPVTPTEKEEKAALDACALLGLRFGGVDLLYGEDDNPYVCEVNSNALFTGLNRVCGVSIHKDIAEMIRTDLAQNSTSLFSLL